MQKFSILYLFYTYFPYIQIYSNVVLIYKNKQKKNIYIYIFFIKTLRNMRVEKSISETVEFWE